MSAFRIEALDGGQQLIPIGREVLIDGKRIAERHHSYKIGRAHLFLDVVLR